MIRKIILTLFIVLPLFIIMGCTKNSTPCSERCYGIGGENCVPCEIDNECEGITTSSCPTCMDIVYKCVPKTKRQKPVVDKNSLSVSIKQDKNDGIDWSKISIGDGDIYSSGYDHKFSGIIKVDLSTFDCGLINRDNCSEPLLTFRDLTKREILDLTKRDDVIYIALSVKLHNF